MEFPHSKKKRNVTTLSFRPKETNITGKYIMQNLYKNQLDDMVK